MIGHGQFSYHMMWVTKRTFFSIQLLRTVLPSKNASTHPITAPIQTMRVPQYNPNKNPPPTVRIIECMKAVQST